MNKKSLVFVLLAAVAVVVFMLSGSLIETNKAGYYQVKQAAVTGEMTVRNTPGTYGQMFGDLETYDYAEEIYLSADHLDGGKEAKNQAVKILFPNGNADVDIVAMYELSLEEKNQLDLHNKYNSNTGVASMVRQQLLEVAKNTGALMSAEEAYSTKRAEYVSLMTAQLIDGLYASEVTIETVTANGQTQKLKHYSVKKDPKTGNPVIKKASVLTAYGIIISQLNVKDMKFDPKTTALIESRKDAQKAQQDAITARAKGESAIASEKARQETDKIKQVTIAEKEAAVAALNAKKEYEVEKFAALKAKETAKKILAEGMAKANANKALVAAGLTPVQEMERDIKIASAVSANIAKAACPQVVIVGGADGGSGAESALKVFGAERSLELIKKLNIGIK